MQTDAMTSCPSSDVLRLVFSGQISRRELEQVEGHLLACPSCAAWLAEQSDSDPLIDAMRSQPFTLSRLASDREAVDALVERSKSKLPPGGAQ